MTLALALTACTRFDSRPDLLLVTLDTTRADVLGAYGRSPSPTPHLDALAAGGTRFEEAMTVTPLTLPAHSSILTGELPTRHGVRDNSSQRLDGDAVTVAERLRGEGYATAAFVSAAVLDHSFGLDQGFDTYSDTVPGSRQPRLGVPRRSGAEVVAEAVAWVGRAPPDHPWFTWVHLYDAHLPHEPGPAHRARFPDDSYLAAVSQLDEHVGMLLAGVRAAGRDPVVVIVADHGEGRGDHDELTHGWFVYRSTMRVPLLIAGPGTPQGDVRTEVVSVADVAPTLCAIAGCDFPAAEGRDLLTGRGDPARVVYGETWTPRLGFGFSELRVVQDAHLRLIDAPTRELYAWHRDPAELTDVLEREVGDPALARLEAVLAEARTGATRGSSAAHLEPELAEMLASLGYVATAEPSQAGPLPDPKTQPDTLVRWEATMIAARTRPPAEAIPLLQAYVDAWPAVSQARLLLARAALLAGRPEPGLAALQGQAANPQADLLRGQLLLVAGRSDEGLAVLRDTSSRWPSWSSARATYAESLRQAGDCVAAGLVATRGLAEAPEDVDLLLVRGACRDDLGESVSAIADLRQAWDLEPDHPDVCFLLGVALARAGRPREALPLLTTQTERTPDRTAAAVALGLAQYETGDVRGAVATLEAVARREDAGAEAPLVLADALLARAEPDDPAEALSWLDVASARTTDRQLHAVRARALKAAGRLAEAQAEAARYQAEAGLPP